MFKAKLAALEALLKTGKDIDKGLISAATKLSDTQLEAQLRCLELVCVTIG